MNTLKRKIKTTPEETLLHVLFILAGIACGAALYLSYSFLAEKLKALSLAQRLAAYPRSYTVLTRAVLWAGAALLALYVLNALGAVFALFKLKFGRVLEAIGLWAQAALFLTGAIALALIGLLVLERLLPEKLADERDMATLYILIYGVSLFALLAAACKALCAIKLAKNNCGMLLTIVSALTACVPCGLYLWVYFRFSQAGQLFSYPMTSALPLKPDAAMFTWLKYIAFVPCAFYAIFALSGRREKARESGFLSLLAVTAFCFIAFCALIEFSGIYSRYQLYSSRVTTFTLLRSPLTALCLAGIAACVSVKHARPFVCAFAAGLAAIAFYQRWISPLPVVLRSFDTAYETALPYAQAAMWALLALSCIVGMCIKRGALSVSLTCVFAVLTLIPAAAALKYCADNYKFIVEYTPALDIADAFIARSVMPSIAAALAVMSLGPGKKRGRKRITRYT